MPRAESPLAKRTRNALVCPAPAPCASYERDPHPLRRGCRIDERAHALARGDVDAKGLGHDTTENRGGRTGRNFNLCSVVRPLSTDIAAARARIPGNSAG